MSGFHAKSKDKAVEHERGEAGRHMRRGKGDSVQVRRSPSRADTPADKEAENHDNEDAVRRRHRPRKRLVGQVRDAHTQARY